MSDPGSGCTSSPWPDCPNSFASSYRVTIPYAQALAEQIPPVAVRLRRDFGSLLALIRSHAVLHQLTRGRDSEGRIVATLADYEAVRELVADVIAAGVDATVPNSVRETVAAVANLATDQGVMASAVAHKLALDKSNAIRRLRMAADGGYVRNLEDRRGKPGRWVIGDPLPEDADLLPQPRNLRATESPDDTAAHSTNDGTGCAVAAEFDPINGAPANDGPGAAEPDLLVTAAPPAGTECSRCGKRTRFGLIGGLCRSCRFPSGDTTGRERRPKTPGTPATPSLSADENRALQLLRIELGAALESTVTENRR